MQKAKLYFFKIMRFVGIIAGVGLTSAAFIIFRHVVEFGLHDASTLFKEFGSFSFVVFWAILATWALTLELSISFKTEVSEKIDQLENRVRIQDGRNERIIAQNQQFLALLSNGTAQNFEGISPYLKRVWDDCLYKKWRKSRRAFDRLTGAANLWFT